MLRNSISLLLIVFLILLFSAPVGLARSQGEPREESSDYARQLSSSDPVKRQAAAEGLARLVALDQRKLVEGFLLQEKDKHVRLSLQWALYRMGKSEMLFQMVRDLNSSRSDQAVGYLSQLEGPEPLYVFLRQEDTHPRVLVGLLEVLAKIGDATSSQEIDRYLDHFDPKVAQAAKDAAEQIQKRQGETSAPTKTRPRTTSKP